MRSLSQTLALAALFSLAACGGAGTVNSAVPPASPDHVAAQSQTRTASEKDANRKKNVDFGYTLFGDAMLVHPGNASNTAAQATSTGPNAFGGVDFAFPAGATYSQLTNLSTDYRFTVGSCNLGSPRFVISVTNGTALGTGNINFYIGPPPNYTGCPPNVWSNTGNLASGLVDDSQLPGGTFYDPYAASQTKFGSYKVTDVFLVVDGTSQTVQFDNSFIGIGSDQTTYTYEKGPDHGANDNDKDDKHKRHHEHDD